MGLGSGHGRCEGFAQAAVGQHRQNADVAAAIMGGVDPFPRGMDGDVAGTFAAAGDLVQGRQRPRSGIHPEGPRPGSVGTGIDRVDHPPVRGPRQVGRIPSTGGGAGGRQGPGGGIEAKAGDVGGGAGHVDEGIGGHQAPSHQDQEEARNVGTIRGQGHGWLLVQ